MLTPTTLMKGAFVMLEPTLSPSTINIGQIFEEYHLEGWQIICLLEIPICVWDASLNPIVFQTESAEERWTPRTINVGKGVKIVFSLSSYNTGASAFRLPRVG